MHKNVQIASRRVRGERRTRTGRRRRAQARGLGRSRSAGTSAVARVASARRCDGHCVRRLFAAIVVTVAVDDRDRGGPRHRGGGRAALRDPVWRDCYCALRARTVPARQHLLAPISSAVRGNC